MRKKIISISLTLFILLSSFTPFSVYAKTLVYEDGHYVIDSAEDFFNIKDMDAVYWVTKDIELSKDFVPIGSEETPFKGKILGRLDGNAAFKPTITVNINGAGPLGLVAVMDGGVINNLILKGTVTADGRKIAGGIVGLMLNGNVENCINYADITATGKSDVYIGGIAGAVKASSDNYIKNCENYAKIVCQTAETGAVGGIVGGVLSSFTKIVDCKNEGEIISTVKNAGGISGISYGLVSACANFGNITNLKGNASGIVSLAGKNIENSFNCGNISGKLSAGGISVTGNADKCYNTGVISSDATASGITVSGNASYCYNIGEINGKKTFDISEFVGENNFYLATSKVNQGALTSDEMLLLDNFNGFSSYYKIDEETEYKFPQLSANKFGSLKKEYQPFADNRIVVEAEDCDISNGIYQIANNKNAIGGKTVVCPKGSNVFELSMVEKSGLSFEFYAPKERKYYIWVRALVKSSGGDSIWYSVDYDNYNKQIFGVDANNFQWFLITSATLTEGVHTINLVPREYNNEIDRILISDTIGLIPSGSGDAKDEGGLSLIFPEPSVKPISEHPRVWFTKEDIPVISSNLEHPQNIAAYNVHKRYLKSNTDGKLNTNSSNNYNLSILSTIKSYAFEYAIKGNEEYGKKAIIAMKNFVDTLRMPEGSYANGGEVVYAVALVYDWCYPLLSEEDKKELRGGALYLASVHSEVKWPPTQQSSWGGHGSENQMLRDLFSLGVATYDEDSYIYDTVMGRIEAQYKPVREVYYDSHKLPHGTDYYNYRFNSDVSLFSIMGNMTGENFWDNDGIHYVPYYLMYTQRPDGFPMAEGDFSIYNIASMEKYSNKKTFDYAFTILSSWYKDGYLKAGFFEEQYDLVPSNHLEYLITNDVTVDAESKENLPLSKYFGYPFSTYVARTGWNMGKNSPDVVVTMNMHELNVSDHNHLDVGEFEIYYKGNLATDSGYYQAQRTGDENTSWGSEYWENYYHQTVAHNCMLIFDPSESTTDFQRAARTFSGVNGGGQYDSAKGGTRSIVNQTPDELLSDEHFKSSEVLGHQAGEDEIKPDFTYLKGDLSYAYSNKVEGYERSFMFLNLKNDKVPGALIVFDRVVSSQPSMKKTYLLHGINAPEISGTRTVLKREENGYNGKLVNDTLLPKADDVEIKQVGEHPDEYWVGNKLYKTRPLEGTMAEGGGIRTEISPVTPKKQDYFLNVMQMSDADSTEEPLESTLIETDTHYGVKIADRVVLFGNQRDRFEGEISFEFDGDEEYKITVADLKEGTWSISLNNEFLKDTVVSKEGGVASFSGNGGKYILTYKNDNTETDPVEITKEFSKYPIKVKINDFYVYTEQKPIMENDRVLVPLRTIFDGLGAEVIWDEETNTATATRFGRKVQVTPDSDKAIVSGYEKELDVPAKLIDGRIFVPLRFVSEAFLAKVNWNNESKTVIISDKFKEPLEGYKAVIDIKWDAGISMEGVDGFNTIDGDTSTSWGTSSSETGVKWISYEFENSDITEVIEILYSRPHQRYFKYDILTSDDGVNWTIAISNGQSEQVTEDKEKEYQTIKLPKNTKCKFLKINCYGNSVNEANNIIEIRFK